MWVAGFKSRRAGNDAGVKDRQANILKSPEFEKQTYVHCRHNGYRLKILPEYRDDDLLRLCCRDNLESLTEGVSRVNSSVYARVFRFEFKGRGYFHKTFLPRNYKEPIKEIFLGTRSDRALRGHKLLLERGYRAPVVIMTGKKGRFNFMVTEEIADSVNLIKFVRNYHNLHTEGHPVVSFRDFIVEMGHLIGALHNSKISHGDLRWGNMMLAVSSDGEIQCNFIDNERTQNHMGLPGHLRLKNLVQLNMYTGHELTHTDRLRFFKAYLQENPSLLPHKKQWLHKTINKTQKRLSRKK